MCTTDTLTPAIPEDEPQTDLAPLSLWQRGMVTAEYVVGIIGAIALALVLLKVFKADSFFTWIFNIITDIFKTITGLVS
ncbi:MAG: DUF4244 domain-containing protein [Propionibacteriaceae bacterium]|nr:DUF4244 domain-containing protein [Propionibacteriaceae bacterium]